MSPGLKAISLQVFTVWVHYFVAASTCTHERSVGENQGVCGARCEYDDVVYAMAGGRAAGGQAVCRRRALWPQAQPHGNEQLLLGPGRTFKVSMFFRLVTSLLSSTCCRARPVDAMQLHSRRDCEAPKALAIGMALFCWRAAHDGRGWARRTAAVAAHGSLSARRCGADERNAFDGPCVGPPARDPNR